MHRLPTAEDVRNYAFADLLERNAAAISPAQQEATRCRLRNPADPSLVRLGSPGEEGRYGPNRIIRHFPDFTWLHLHIPGLLPVSCLLFGARFCHDYPVAN